MLPFLIRLGSAWPMELNMLPGVWSLGLESHQITKNQKAGLQFHMCIRTRNLTASIQVA